MFTKDELTVRKNSLYGVILIAFMLSLLLVFPFLGTFFSGSSTGSAFNEKSISPFFLKNEEAHIVFVYFGYVGCSHICTPSLQEITAAYGKLKQVEPKIKIYFVNLNPSQSSEAPDLFAKGFHREFEGVYASFEQVNQLAKAYNLAITGDADELGHSSSLFMFVKRPAGYVLKNIYSVHPYPIQQIIVDLQKVQI